VIFTAEEKPPIESTVCETGVLQYMLEKMGLTTVLLGMETPFSSS
jgi:hypothetical protein